MKSLYIRCARFGSNSDEWMSTQTDGCFSLKSSGSSVYGIRWNHISFMAGLLLVSLLVSRPFVPRATCSQPRPPPPASVARPASMPRRLASGSTSIHSSSECSRAPVPPEPILIAGMPRLIGILASVEDASKRVSNPFALIAALANRTQFMRLAGMAGGPVADRQDLHRYRTVPCRADVVFRRHRRVDDFQETFLQARRVRGSIPIADRTRSTPRSGWN